VSPFTGAGTVFCSFLQENIKPAQTKLSSAICSTVFCFITIVGFCEEIIDLEIGIQMN
jgi:hypothetical protein